MKKLIIIAFCIARFVVSHAQTITQTVTGKVTDEKTQEAILGAMIILAGSEPVKGTTSGLDGTFILQDVPVGRQSVECRMMGYEKDIAAEVLVSSGKEVILNFRLKESTSSLDELVVVYKADKNKPINEMSAVSSRQFTVEETQRYAGGMDDPARMVSSFAGVVSPSVSSNGISVRGNSPAGLLWRVEGVEVPSPNHFADLSVAGAGALTALSSHVLGNSDFMTGAFPAEYGNASSGVFDMNLRSGNSSQKEHTLQVGLLGVDFATEGPFKKGKQSTYLLNYRYSTLALIGSFLPSDAGILKYQDLSFKVDMPTKNAGKFSFWSVSAYDGIDIEADEPSEWTAESNRDNSRTSMYMFASGLNHRLPLSSKTFLNTSLAFTGNGLSFDEQFVDDDLDEIPQSDAHKKQYKYTLQSSLNTHFSNRHYNKTGFYINNLRYDMDLAHTPTRGATPETIAKEDGQSYLLQLYSQSRFELSPRVILNAGIHSQYFQLNEELTVEPRLSIGYKLTSNSDLSFAYGLHSKIESLGVYFVKDELGNEPNRELKLMKSHHYVLSYSTRIGNQMKFTVEPYYQYLTDVPVAPNSYVSTINMQDNLFFNETLLSNGTGRNVGLDITLERYLHNGFYSLLTASIFDSKYTANDGIERNTRLNKNYVFNAVVGKEWQVGRNNNNTFGANIRLNYMGGNRVEAIDEARSVEEQRVVFGETNGQLSYTEKTQDMPIWSFTLSYRKNKPKAASVWSLQILNAGQTAEYDGPSFNSETQQVQHDFVGIMIPNLSYKIEF